MARDQPANASWKQQYDLTKAVAANRTVNSSEKSGIVAVLNKYRDRHNRIATCGYTIQSSSLGMHKAIESLHNSNQVPSFLSADSNRICIAHSTTPTHSESPSRPPDHAFSMAEQRTAES